MDYTFSIKLDKISLYFPPKLIFSLYSRPALLTDSTLPIPNILCLITSPFLKLDDFSILKLPFTSPDSVRNLLFASIFLCPL